MQTHKDIIARWPSISDFASEVRVRYGTAQVMKYRGNIAARYWVAVVTAAEKRGFHDITLEKLAEIEARRTSRSRPRRRPRGAAAAA